MRFVLVLAAIALGIMAGSNAGDQNWNEAWFYLACWAMCVIILFATREKP